MGTLKLNTSSWWTGWKIFTPCNLLRTKWHDSGGWIQTQAKSLPTAAVSWCLIHTLEAVLGDTADIFCKGTYEFAILKVLGYLCNPTIIPPAVTRTLATNKSREEEEKWFGPPPVNSSHLDGVGVGLFPIRHLLIFFMSTKASLTDFVLNLCDYFFYSL